MEQNTYLVLSQYRDGSEYEDEVGVKYHFPRKYFNQLTLLNIEFIYFEPRLSTRRGVGVSNLQSLEP